MPGEVNLPSGLATRDRIRMLELAVASGPATAAEVTSRATVYLDWVTADSDRGPKRVRALELAVSGGLATVAQVIERATAYLHFMDPQHTEQ